MTRQEEIDNAKTAFYERVLKDDYYYDPRDCFEEGAKWADAHPKSPWISVDEDLPCNHKEMIKVDLDTHTKRVLAIINEEVMIVAYMYKLDIYWYWSETERVTHWMPIPELPKE